MRTRCRTFRSIPRVAGVSSRSTERPILPSPRARKVPRCLCDWPIWLRVCVILSLLIGQILRNNGRCFLGGNRLSLRLFSREQNLVHGLAALLCDLFWPPKASQTVDGRLQKVDRVRVAEALGEDVPDSRELEHRAHAAPGDDARALACGAQEDAGGVRPAQHLV